MRALQISRKIRKNCPKQKFMKEDMIFRSTVQSRKRRKKGNDDFYTHEVTLRILDDGKAKYLSNHILEDRLGMIPDYQYRCG